MGSLLAVTPEVHYVHYSWGLYWQKGNERAARDTAMKKHSVMSPELIGILAVGVSLAGLMLTGFLYTNNRLDSRIDGLDARLRTVERNQTVLLERTKHLNPAMAMEAAP